jgi:hypothetical protein
VIDAPGITIPQIPAYKITKPIPNSSGMFLIPGLSTTNIKNLFVYIHPSFLKPSVFAISLVFLMLVAIFRAKI